MEAGVVRFPPRENQCCSDLRDKQYLSLLKWISNKMSFPFSFNLINQKIAEVQEGQMCSPLYIHKKTQKQNINITYW